MRQHLVSQVILRRFADHRNGPISGLDLDSLEQRTDSVDAFGAVEDLIPEGDTQAIEQQWNSTVESPMPHALQLLDSGDLLRNDDAIDRVKKCMALHWARSFTLAVMIDSFMSAQTDRITTELLQRFSPQQALHAMTGGLNIVGFDMRTLVRDGIDREFNRHLENDGFLRQEYERQFATVHEKIAPFSLEVWTANETEFLIGDVPVAAWDKDTGRVGPLNGVSWDKADAIFMPLGPKHVVALSREPTSRDADASAVIKLNRLQITGAYKEIYFRTGSELGDVVAEALRASTAGPS